MGPAGINASWHIAGNLVPAPLSTCVAVLGTTTVCGAQTQGPAWDLPSAEFEDFLGRAASRGHPPCPLCRVACWEGWEIG